MNAFTLMLAASTFCNPMPIPDTPVGILVRDVPNGTAFCSDTNSWKYVFWRRGADCKLDSTRQFRELADPVVYVENDRWYLYPSCGLLWTSDDCGGTWTHVKSVERGEYAPAVAKFRGKYYLTTSGGPLHVSDSPTGPWTLLGRFDLKSFGSDPQMPHTQDPALLADGDGLYLYWGCCAKPKSLWGVELDPENPTRAKTPGSAVCLMEFDERAYPWLKELIEGVWVFKRGPTYYLTYSTANTAEDDYQWCCSKSSRPLGPFTPQARNPFFMTRKGLVTGTGHGSIWCHNRDEWWINYCVHVGAYHGFERLIGQDRLFFDENGDIAAGSASETPQWLPSSGKTGDTGWRKVALAGGPVEPTDGRFSTWWAAETGLFGGAKLPATLEYSLAEGPHELRAMRLIWRDLGLDTVRGVTPGPYRYRVEARVGGEWCAWIDASENGTDLHVDYREAPTVTADAVRLTVLGGPKGIVPAVAEFTVFGTPAVRARYLFCGDSITGQSRNHTEGWAHQMDACLAEAAATSGSAVVPELVSLGGSGMTVKSWHGAEKKSRTVRDGRMDIKRWKVGEELDKAADATVVMLGMNDVLCPSLGDRTEDFDRWEATYREVLESVFARSKAKRRFVASVPPCTEEPGGFKNVLLDRIDERIAKICKDLGATYVPVHEALLRTLAEGRRIRHDFHVTDDFVHPNGIGHAVIALEFLKALGEENAAKLAERNLRARLRQFAEVQPGLSWRLGRPVETAESGVFRVPLDVNWVQRWNDPPTNAVFALAAPAGWTVGRTGRDGFVLTGRPTDFRTAFTLTGRQDGITRTATVHLPAPWRVTLPQVRKKDFKALTEPVPGEFTWVPYFASVDDTGLDDPNSVDFTRVDHIPAFAGAFAERIVVAPRDCEATLDIGSVQFAGFSALTVWLNGEQVFDGKGESRLDGNRGHKTARVRLGKGENRLMFKSVRFTWQWQLFVGLVPDDPSVELKYALRDLTK